MSYLSALPTPTSILTIDYESILASYQQRLVSLNPALSAAVGLEQSATNIILETEAYGEMLVQQRINIVYQALRLAYATGSDLDGLAADRGVIRLTYVPATSTSIAIMEGDDSLRLRTFLRMQTWGAGTLTGIEYWGRTLGAQFVSDVRAVDHPGEGRISLVVLPSPSNTADQTAAVLSTIGSGLMARHRRPGSIVIDTVAADIVTVNYVGTLQVRSGTSTIAPLSNAIDGLTTYMASRRKIGALVSLSVMQAQQVGTNVVDVTTTSPSSDVVTTEFQAAQLGTVTITPVLIND